jgi:XTP/dITP diphosphohydrolase
MSRLTKGTRLVVASHNKGKLVEIDDLVRPFGLDTVSAAQLNIPEPDETETTFVGNARLKALHSARASGLPALSDDSGIEVHALGGEPGVYTANWAGPGRDFSVAMQRVADRLTAKAAWGPPAPTANFLSCLCLAFPDGTTQEFVGTVDGHLVWPPRGTKGFGYDPMFVPDGAHETYGEMVPAIKHATSHRAKAFALFVAACLKEPSSE